MHIERFNELCKQWHEAPKTQGLGSYLIANTEPRILDPEIENSNDKSVAASLFFSRHVKTSR